MGDGLGGLSFGGGSFGSPITPAPPSGIPNLGASAASPVQKQQPQEDLLGLF